MWLKFVVFNVVALTISICERSSVITFQNVRIQGYAMYTLKFNKTIDSSNNLVENLPEIQFDRIDIVDTNVPILYENSISNIENLDELIMARNGLKDIQPGALKNLLQLRKLEITENSLEDIKKGVFNDLPVNTLDLRKNQIKNIAPDAFDDMKELLTINLNDNQITSWNNNWFKNTPLLSRVSLIANRIEELPAHAFKNLEGEKKFGSLDLSVNIIFSNNQISKIDKNAFKNLKKINNLWLDYNKLTEWDWRLLKGIKVKNLGLTNNLLECIPEDKFEQTFIAETTNIDGNPWECGCLKNIETYSKKNNNIQISMYYAKMTCDVQRIEAKMASLNNLMKEIRNSNDNNSI